MTTKTRQELRDDLAGVLHAKDLAEDQGHTHAEDLGVEALRRYSDLIDLVLTSPLVARHKADALRSVAEDPAMGETTAARLRHEADLLEAGSTRPGSDDPARAALSALYSPMGDTLSGYRITRTTFGLKWVWVEPGESDDVSPEEFPALSDVFTAIAEDWERTGNLGSFPDFAPAMRTLAARWAAEPEKTGR